ncbi:hypothetical protein GGR50DRAFT_164744 [Xylaria sp. CBS 124048]|nr:hypothetical protein GGR50DRAFT_164744 [Xylaria sp. CBS 124048]
MSSRGAPGASGRGASSRGRGGKFKKFTRGGGKHFSRDLRPLDADGNEVSMWSENALLEGGDNDSEGSSDDSEEDSDDDSDAGPSQPQPELTREERKALKKAQKDAAAARKQKGQVQVGDLPSDSEEEEEDDDMPANPNHSKAARQQTRAPAPDVEETTAAVSKLSVNKSTMSRREREALEKQQAAERYRKLHAEGKTDEAKADMARLRLIREKREADAARRQAEKEERESQDKERLREREAKEAKRREAALGKPPGKASKGKKA